MAGDASNYSNWGESQPDDYAGYRQDCAWVDARTGQWRDLACDGGVRFDPLPWRLAELSCLCARGNASATFAVDVEVLEATSGDNERLLSARTAIAFAAAITVALLPTLLLLSWAGWRRLRRACGSADSELVFFALPALPAPIWHWLLGIQGAISGARSARAAAPVSPSSTDVSPSSRASSYGPEPSGSSRRTNSSSGPHSFSGPHSSAAGVIEALRAALQSAAGRRLHVSFAMGQAGWALSAITLTPAIMFTLGQPIDADVGPLSRWIVPFPLGVCLLALALFPTDARSIRVMCATFIVLCTGFSALITVSQLTDQMSGLFGLLSAALLFAIACALVPTQRCRGYRAMQPRPALRWLWTVFRLSFLGFGVLLAGFNIACWIQGVNHFDHRANVATSATLLLCAALATPHNRGRLHHRLGRLGGRGTEAEEAAAVAALVGGSDPDAALERASKLLRCLPANQLFAADLADNTNLGPADLVRTSKFRALSTATRLGVSNKLRALSLWTSLTSLTTVTSPATPETSSTSDTSSTTAGPTLYERTEPAAMGEVTAFLSHSWSDEKNAPGAKHAVVSRWAKRRREKTGKEPTLWLVALAQSLHAPSRRCMLMKYTRLASHRRTRHASTRTTSSSRSPACPSSSRAAGRCSSWLGPHTAQGCGASWSSSHLFAVTACYVEP